MSKAYINGKIIPLKDAKISVLDRGLLYGDGVFESLRTYNGRPFLLEEHIKRLLKGLKTLKIRSPLSAKQFKLAVLKTLASNKFKESYIKIIVTRGEAQGHGLDPAQTSGRPTLIMLVEEQKPTPKKLYVQGWKVIISSIIKPNAPTSRIKTLNYADNILAKLEAKKNGANEAFLLDKNGDVAEGTVSNVFIVKRGNLYTPAKESPILPGLTRELVIKLAKQSASRVFEKNLSPEELYAADECFITLSGIGIVPITSVWNKKIGNGKCGHITASLIKLYGSMT
ncbi:hypothetical protein A3H38_05855 [candidate division WOR-1 bacterium RIFCSPLOWO2_02_FULL_46_20]|uniref:Branched-chain-amino-acid aminotransferase n=2 Tax=Saganbacteria TaxID=1703751 RepID=A0A1F4RBE1_UNCSA|nr:MAG: hypothetical protein A3J44_04515 [candidate division WOR-1 bacterium RIFCSPHIGHO2_02_FULL_45_12]OGC05488.1 MAG: hypothetical protein A3H38_05855 [candidate division WOR-1 bacterium RIFCSPLOWO2_02_FULL_46_20]OGC08140.1 MAG: hypothetical protein A3F86_01085 [candidate division WOR-1 bacterium RIFCSPLOWO2_12_FULL_45_9]